MSIDRRQMKTGYVPLREAIDQLFEGSFITPQTVGSQGNMPHVDMHLTESEVVIDMAVPGAQPDDIQIAVTGETVTISGELPKRQREGRNQPYVEEIWRGRFQRSFQLPIQVDARKADATYEHGILTLALPRSEATKPRKIQVRTQSTITHNDNANNSDARSADVDDASS